MTRARDLAAFVSNADGDIKFDTDTLFIDSSTNNVGIGTSTPNAYTGYSGLTLNHATNGGLIDLEHNGTLVGEMFLTDVNTFTLQALGSKVINFSTNSVERMRIDGSGNFIFNEGSNDCDFRIESNGEANMFHVDGAANSIGIGETGLAAYSSAWGTVDTTRQLSIKGSAYGVLHLKGDVGTNAHFTMGAGDGKLYGAFDAVGGKHHVLYHSNNSTVFNDDSNNLDFRIEGDNQAACLFVDASADSVMIGTSSGAVDKFTFNALETADNYAWFGHGDSNVNSPPLYVNRQASDGSLVQFLHASTNEGSISVSGSTVSFNGFSGRHESSGIPTNTPVGTVVSTIDELDVYPDKTTDTKKNAIDHPKAGQTRANHPKVEVSTSEGDACVYGVVAEFDGDEKLIVTSVGIGSVRVTGACAKGDLLESNGDGTAKVQSDDIIRSKTIGKVTIGNSNTGVKLVSCVMYCG